LIHPRGGGGGGDVRTRQLPAPKPRPPAYLFFERIGSSNGLHSISCFGFLFVFILYMGLVVSNFTVSNLNI